MHIFAIFQRYGCEVDAQLKLQKTIRDRTQQNSQMNATFELLEKEIERKTADCHALTNSIASSVRQ